MDDLLLIMLFFALLKIMVGWRAGIKQSKSKALYNDSFNWTVVPYYSNGILIHEPHWLHYAKTLNLLHIKEIDEEDILKASSSLLPERLKSGPYFKLTERREISAATFFLLDKWNYIAHLN